MLDFPLKTSDPEVYVAELVQMIAGEEFFENDEIVWNPDVEEDLPKLWVKKINWAMEWYRDNPSRGTFCSHESDLDTSLYVLDIVRGIYGSDSGREEA